MITGASRGIGAACARRLARAGHEVLINYSRDRAGAEAVARETGGSLCRADVSDPAQVQQMFENCGRVDALVCNAGIALSRLLTDLSDEEWRRILSTNLDGVFYCCRAALPAMIRRQAGRIVTVSSMWGVTGASMETAYSASKAAVIGLTRALAKEVGPSGITVNCVAPGVIDTEMNRNLTDADRAALRDETPLGRIGTPEQVAGAVHFLLSEDADFMTGQVLGVNGGFVI